MSYIRPCFVHPQSGLKADKPQASLFIKYAKLLDRNNHYKELVSEESSEMDRL